MPMGSGALTNSGGTYPCQIFSNGAMSNAKGVYGTGSYVPLSGDTLTLGTTLAARIINQIPINYDAQLSTATLVISHMNGSNVMIRVYPLGHTEIADTFIIPAGTWGLFHGSVGNAKFLSTTSRTIVVDAYDPTGTLNSGEIIGSIILNVTPL